MSDSGPPGRRPRTIVVPNPGGRRREGTDAGFGPQSAPPGYPPPPQGNPYGNPWDTAPGPRSQPMPGPMGAPPPGPQPQPMPGSEPAIDPTQAPVAAAALLHSRPALNDNAMVRAAQPLLLMLSRMRAGLVQAQSARIMEEVAATIHNFEQEVQAAGYSDDQVQVAKYALCSTADDVIQNIPVDDRQRWTQYSMLSRFFSERIGGIRFFEELKRMRADPIANVAVLELMYACMAAGFEGVYRTSPGGVSTLQQVQRDIYDTIRRVRPRESNELSPRWQGMDIPVNQKSNRVPLWAMAAIFAGLLLGTFFLLRTLLTFDAAEVADELLALHPLTPVTIVRADFRPAVAEPEAAAEPVAPPPPAPEVVQVRDLLAEEIAEGSVIVDDAGSDIRITIGDIVGLVLFNSGSTEITEKFVPIVEKIGRILNDEPGPITVVGHTDFHSDPLGALPLQLRAFGGPLAGGGRHAGRADRGRRAHHLHRPRRRHAHRFQCHAGGESPKPTGRHHRAAQ